MPNNLDRRFVSVSHNTEGDITVYDKRGVDFATIDDPSERRLCEAGANVCGNVMHTDRRIKMPLGTIRKGNNRHEYSLSSGGHYQRPREGLHYWSIFYVSGPLSLPTFPPRQDSGAPRQHVGQKPNER